MELAFNVPSLSTIVTLAVPFTMVTFRSVLDIVTENCSSASATLSSTNVMFSCMLLPGRKAFCPNDSDGNTKSTPSSAVPGATAILN